VRELLERMVRAGATFESAATAAGVSARSVRRWRAAGELELEPAQAALEQALGEAALVLTLARRGSWRAAASTLERLFPERWARPSRRGVDFELSLDAGSLTRRER
jgi:hypothetical protein